MGKGNRDYEGPRGLLDPASMGTLPTARAQQEAAAIRPATPPPEPPTLPDIALRAIAAGPEMARQYALGAAKLCEGTLLPQSRANAQRLLRLALEHLGS